MGSNNKGHYKVIKTHTIEEMTETLNGFYEEGYVLVGQVMPVVMQFIVYYTATLCLKD